VVYACSIVTSPTFTPRRAWARLVALLAFVFVLAIPAVAQAYPWMIRHGSSNCQTCHVDPSGAGMLTQYGRIQSEQLLRMHYGEKPKGSKMGNFLWGLVDLPKEVLLGGAVRTLVLHTMPKGEPASSKYVIMQADLRAALRMGPIRASGSIGYSQTAGSLAAITHNGTGKDNANNLVSREHWLGAAFDGDAWLVRAGRMNVPFGIRDINHNLFARMATRTNIKDAQQHGIAIAYTDRDGMRAELMGILGNYQISPDRFRDRGYSGTFEYTVATRTAVGVSSMVTHAKEDYDYHIGLTRQAHGLFVRTAPWAPLVLMAEGDYVVLSPTTQPPLPPGAPPVPTSHGFVSYLTADLEPIQGLHFMATGEMWNPGGDSTRSSLGGWLTAAWFFFSHADMRVDLVHNKLALGNETLRVTSILAQLHVWL
jgi:hypothetical protein